MRRMNVLVVVNNTFQIKKIFIHHLADAPLFLRCQFYLRAN